MNFLQLCPICLERKRLNYTGICSNCRLAAHLRERFPAPTLSRAEFLARSNDGTEYETPVLEQEMVG